MCNLSDLVEEQAIERGLAKGLEQGIQQGIQQGVQSIVCNMHTNGKSPEEIAELTLLPLEKVLKLLERE